MSASDFGDWFRSAMGAECPLPAELRPTVQLSGGVWISPSLARSTAALPPMRPEFLAEPREYVIAGQWGHGVATYALYYVAVTPRHRVFFRLPFGGVLGDRARDAAFAVRFLAAYVELRARRLPALERSTLIHDMGASWAELTCGGETQRLSDEEMGERTPPGRFFWRLDELLARRPER